MTHKLRIGQKIKLRPSWVGTAKYRTDSGTITEIALGTIFIHLDDGTQLQILQSVYPTVFIVDYSPAQSKDR